MAKYNWKKRKNSKVFKYYSYASGTNISFRVETSSPAGPQIGDMYYDTVASTYRIYIDNQWIEMRSQNG